MTEDTKQDRLTWALRAALKTLKHLKTLHNVGF